ncbi:MAG: type II toxin-antitoxin system ParD family antitoxin [Acidobacteriota bacterium]
MNVSLTPELEKLVQEKVKSGRYNSASEVMREALRLLEEQDQLRAIRLEEVRQRIAAGLESLDRGEGIDGEEAFERLRKRSEARRRTRS